MLMVFVSLPVLVLHGAADKVDVAMAVVSAASLFWLYWWMERDARTSTFVLAWGSACLAVGFKRTGLVFLGLCCAALAWRAWRQSWRATARLVTAAIVSGLFLGLVGAANNFVAFSGVFGAEGGIQSYVRAENAGLFTPSQVFAYPALLNLVPLSNDPLAVYVPWRAEAWYWPATNLFFSHWGFVFNALVVISLLAAPLALRRALRGNRRYDLPLLGLGTYLLLVAKSYAYEGGFNSFPRYTLFYAVFLAVYLALPWAMKFTQTPRSAGLAFVLATLWLFGNFSHYARADYYTPLSQVWRRWQDPEARRIIPAGARRAPCLLDRVAAPGAVIATDVTYMTWVHPLYGERLGRTVHMLRPRSDGSFKIPPDAEWVVADNVANVVWGLNTPARTAGDQLRAFNRGHPTERDTALYRQLQRDPQFQLLHVESGGAQAVFRRLPKLAGLR